MIGGKMPDLTPAQLVAALGWVVAQLVAYGLLDARYQQVVVSGGATVLAAAWHLADGYLRAHRALAVAQTPNITALPVAPASPPADPPAAQG